MHWDHGCLVGECMPNRAETLGNHFKSLFHHPWPLGHVLTVLSPRVPPGQKEPKERKEWVGGRAIHHPYHLLLLPS